MPWDELPARRFSAFDNELDGISRQTMEDHFKLYEGYAKKANECRRLLNEFDYAEIEGNQVYSQLRAVSIGDHVNRQLIQAQAAREGAGRSGAREHAHA